MLKIVISFLILTSLLFAQEVRTNYLSGSLVNDTYFALNELSDSNSLQTNLIGQRKTPILSALMSFAIPGAGQVYTGNYIKAGIFAALEVGAIILAVNYNNKGDDQTDYYENYANENWSAARYADWTITNISSLNLELDPNSYNLFNNNGDVVWSELNKLESDIGGYYSHRLAPYGDQQYYEMIGKYSQFNVGWQEFQEVPNGSYIWNVDPVVDEFKWYSKERGKANDYYNVSKWAVIAVVSNHFISAIDAAWSASKYNKALEMNVSIEEETIGFYKEYYPQLNLSYNF